MVTCMILKASDSGKGSGLRVLAIPLASDNKCYVKSIMEAHHSQWLTALFVLAQKIATIRELDLLATF